MKKIKIKDCNLHDTIIADINYAESVLTLRLTTSPYEEECCGSNLELQVEEDDFSICYIRQRPFFRKIILSGRDTSLNFIKALFKKGYTLSIEEVLLSNDSNLILITCAIFPSPKRRGSYRKIIFKLYCDCDEINLQRIE